MRLKLDHLPDTPGVYYFIRSTSPQPLSLPRRGVDSRAASGGEVLYVGKATSLYDRVKSYFLKDILVTRGPKVQKMLEEADRVEFKETPSVLEALILEANEIKRHQPIYNSREKDDKSYNFVTITDEDFPKIFITRGSGDYGPYPHSGELREALKIIRKIFPFRDEKCKLVGKPCFNAQIGLCPGACAGWISKEDYRKNIRNIKLFFEGKKEDVIKNLEKEMKSLAKEHKFEEADKIKKKIFALDHIQDIALIKQDLGSKIYDLGFRIEAYDIAHLSGREVVGVMTVVEDGEANRSQYRKFKIKADKNDDTKNLKEVLSRRFNHSEWRFPDLIVVDGGKSQLNVVRKITKIPAVAVTKDEHHKAKQIIPKSHKGRTLSTDSQGSTLDKAILLANAEAHRFAINYHRLLRNKGFRV